MTANRAVLDVASRFRETLLLNAYTMASNAVSDGSRDSWLATPVTQNRRDPHQRAPRGYIIPATQPDFPTATKFVDALLKAGVAVHRAQAAFRVDGITYPAGSFVVKTAQPFRAHVLDMFEPQHYPDDQTPYDIAGWTLALQMGVKFDRMLDAFDGPLVRIDSAGPPRADDTRTRRRRLLPQPSSERQRGCRQSPAACRRAGARGCGIGRSSPATRPVRFTSGPATPLATSSPAPHASWACRSARLRRRLRDRRFASSRYASASGIGTAERRAAAGFDGCSNVTSSRMSSCTCRASTAAISLRDTTCSFFPTRRSCSASIERRSTFRRSTAARPVC